MKCPYCAEPESKVIDSRLNQNGDLTRRRRSCSKCSGRFTTYERIEEIMPAISKKDGRIEPYQREKVMNGVQKSCEKRKVTTIQMEEIVNRIEKRIQSYGVKEIPSKTIGQLLCAALHETDKVAYIRFAAVYREFQDVDDFVSELKEYTPDENLAETLTFPFINSTEDSNDNSSDQKKQAQELKGINNDIE